MDVTLDAIAAALDRSPRLALDRAGGRDRLFTELRRYSRLYEIGTDPPRPVEHDELAGLARDVASRPVDQGVADHTDLLALA